MNLCQCTSDAHMADLPATLAAVEGLRFADLQALADGPRGLAQAAARAMLEDLGAWLAATDPALGIEWDERDAA